MMRGVDGISFQVCLGNVRARCLRCGATYFVPAEPGDELTHFSDLVCAACEDVTTYAALIIQIGVEGLNAARALLHLEAPEGKRAAGKTHGTIGSPWPFSAMCPNGHFARQEGWDKEKLWAALRRNEPIRLHCIRCDNHWDASDVQKTALEFALPKSF